MKSFISLGVLLALAASATAQYKILSIQCPGGGSPQQYCSHNGFFSTSQASFSGTELNIFLTGHDTSDPTAPPGASQFECICQGSVYWTVQYTGATAPPNEAPVTLEFTSSINLDATLPAVGCSATELGDEVFGVQSAPPSPNNKSGSLEEVYTSVGAWVEVSSGVWQGNTGYYSPNVSVTGTVAPTPPSPTNESLGTYSHNAKIVLINGQPVTGG